MKQLGRRVWLHSGRKTTMMWPTIMRNADENCNACLTFVLWPVGHVDVFYRWVWRTDADGPCGMCRAERRSTGACEWCGARPCWCAEIFSAEAIAVRR